MAKSRQNTFFKKIKKTVLNRYFKKTLKSGINFIKKVANKVKENYIKNKNNYRQSFFSLKEQFRKKIIDIKTKILYSNGIETVKENVLKDSRAQFSKQVSKLICENYENKSENSSFIFGLSGKWGIGKTRFLDQLKIDLEKDGKFIVIVISPWKYGAEKLTFLRSFLKSLNKEANEQKFKKNRKFFKFLFGLFIKKKLPENLSKDVQTIKFGLWYFLLILIFGLIWFVYKQFAPDSLVIFINIKLKYIKQVGLAIFTLFIIPKIASFITVQEQNKAISTLDDFDEILIKILKKFPESSKIAIFVDDLDRVIPDVARNVLDILRTFFDQPQMTFVVTGDHSVLERHIGSQIIVNSTIPEQIEEGRRYLKKVFNVYWPLPTQNNSEFDAFLKTLLKEKKYLKKSIFNRNLEELTIFREWLLNYFEKNFRNVNRFIDAIIFNFEIINNQLKNNTDSKIDEQLKDLKKHPLLVVRMLMIQEFAAPLFEDYTRTPSLVGQIEYEISSKGGVALNNQIKKMNDDKRLSPSQEQFLRKFMYEEPRFYNTEEGGIVVRSIDPFLYLVASSDFSDIRGLSTDDFNSMLEKSNQEQMFTALENSGPKNLKAIVDSLFEKLSSFTVDNVNKFNISLLDLVAVISRIDSEKPVQELFRDFFTKIDTTILLTDTIPIEQRSPLYCEFWKWLDKLPEGTDFEHYFHKFELNNPAQIELVPSILEKFEKFGNFSSKIIVKWLVFLFSTKKDESIKYLNIVKDKITIDSFSELLPLKDELISIITSQPDATIGQQAYEILSTVNVKDINELLDQRLAEQIDANNSIVSNWLADNFNAIKKLTGSVRISNSIIQIIENIIADYNYLNTIYSIHSKLLFLFKNEIWEKAKVKDSNYIWQLTKVIQDNNYIATLTPSSSIANDITLKIFNYAVSKIDEVEEAEILKVLKKSEFWNQLNKLSMLSRLQPKTRAVFKPTVKTVAEEIIQSWKTN